MQRREFLGAAATAALAANDRISYGMIGTGSRGRWLQGAFQKGSSLFHVGSRARSSLPAMR